MRSRSAGVALTLAAIAAAGCGRKLACHEYLVPEGAISRDDLLEMQKRIAAGKDPCPQLAAPRMDVGAKGVVLDGNVVVPQADLPSGSLKRVDKLFDDLKADRELWKMLHPAQPFEARLDVTFAADTETVAGVSVLRTAVFAGYATLSVHVGGVDLDMVHAVPRPPDAESKPPIVLWVARHAGGGIDVRFEPKRAPTPGSPDMGPPVKPAAPVANRTVPDVAALVDLVTRECPAAGPACADELSVRTDETKLVALVTLARSVLRAPPFAAHAPAVMLESP